MEMWPEWQGMFVTPIRGHRKEDQEFKASVDYIQSREREGWRDREINMEALF